MSLINQMLKDIDKRHASTSSMPAANHDLQGVMKSKFPLRAVWVGGSLVAVFAVASVVVLNGRRAQTPATAQPAAVLASAPVQLASTPLPVTSSSAQVVSVPVVPVVNASAPLSAVSAQAASSPSVGIKAKVTEAPKVVVPAAPVATTVTAAPAVQPVPKSGSITRVLTAEQRAEDLYREAVEQIKQGRMSQAQGILKRVLSEHPLHHPSRQLLARSLVEDGQVEEAQNLLRDGLTIAPNRLDFYIALAHVSLSKNDMDTAIKVLESGLPAASDNAEFHAFLATLLQRNGRHDEAIQHYVIALRKAPDSANWLLGLGISLQEKKDKASAAEAYQRAIDLGLPPSLMQFAQDRLRQLNK